MTNALITLFDPKKACNHAGSVLLLLLSFLLLAGAWRISRGGDMKEFGKEETLPLRTLLAFAVIIGHVDNTLGRIFPILGWLHWPTPAVAVFFFLSGFGLRKVFDRLAENGGLGEYLARFPWRATARLLPPFLVLGPLYATWRCYVGKAPWAALPARFLNLSILHIPHDWYVVAIAVLYAVFLVSAALFRKRGVTAAVWTLSIVLWCATCLWTGNDPKCRYWHFTPLSFPVGFTFAQYERKIRAAFASRPFTVACAVIAAEALFFLLHKLKGIPVIVSLNEPWLCAIGPICALVLYAFDGLKRVKFLCFLGLFSYEIYLVHGLPRNMLWYAGIRGWYYVAAMFAVSIPAAWLLWKFDSFATKALTGGWRRGRGAPPTTPEGGENAATGNDLKGGCR